MQSNLQFRDGYTVFLDDNVPRGRLDPLRFLKLARTGSRSHWSSFALYTALKPGPKKDTPPFGIGVKQ